MGKFAAATAMNWSLGLLWRVRRSLTVRPKRLAMSGATRKRSGGRSKGSHGDYRHCDPVTRFSSVVDVESEGRRRRGLLLAVGKGFRILAGAGRNLAHWFANRSRIYLPRSRPDRDRAIALLPTQIRRESSDNKPCSYLETIFTINTYLQITINISYKSISLC